MTKTVPLYGKVAAGRVALVDDTDYAFVMLYRWNVWELRRPGKRPQGPYAVTSYLKEDGRRVTIKMHNLIMGAKGVDHRDHDGLNNLRSNLRVTTKAQNNRNARPKIGRSSQYKGVHWNADMERWVVGISRNGRRCYVGVFDSEIEAAYVYDREARKEFGEYAFTNFSDAPTRAMLDAWAAESAKLSAGRKLVQYDAVRQWWAERESVDHVCEHCGKPYKSKATVTRYCSTRCCKNASYRRRKGKPGQPPSAALF